MKKYDFFKNMREITLYIRENIRQNFPIYLMFKFYNDFPNSIFTKLNTIFSFMEFFYYNIHLLS